MGVYIFFLISVIFCFDVQVLPSPTTGAFQSFNWKSNIGSNDQQSVKQENKNQSDFSFPTQTRPNTTSSIVCNVI